MEPVLKFVNVNKYYNNNVHALHNINLEIAAGEFISVIGPSGSGKSTLLRTVNRLIDVSDGEICLDGENITSIGGKKLRAVRRKVGMIFQNYNLVYRLSVLQNVLHLIETVASFRSTHTGNFHLVVADTGGDVQAVIHFMIHVE